jgi:nicotinamide-nucleotide amidase
MKDIFAEILTIGDEILYGQIIDTNSQWISAELDKIGIRIRRKSSIGDQAQEILDALKEAEKRSDIILITGGLGPTNDDITKKTLCTYFNSTLVLNEEALQEVTAFFNKRGRELTGINRQQAFLPDSCTYIPNRSGTAPGMWFDRNGKVFMSMPGVPFEMKSLMAQEVIPRLREKFKTPVIYHKVIRTVGIGESFLAEKIKDWEASLPSHLKLAYLPSYSEVKLRLTASGEEKDALLKDVEKQVASLLTIVPELIFGYDDDSLEKVIGNLLIQNKKTISTAESCTGGNIAYTLTSIAGSSEYFLGSVVAYHNSIKINILGVKEQTLEEHGAVSEDVVKEMAEGIRKKFNTDVAVSVSGIAGPGGGTEDKPIGTVWIAYSDKDQTVARKLIFGNIRDVNIKLSTIAALNLVRQCLTGTYKP